MTREASRRRLAELERKLLPPPEVIWNPWQRILTKDEYEFVWTLSHRGARHGEDGDDWPVWRELCRDDRERALLEGIRAKSAEHRGNRRHDQLSQFLTDLRL